MTDIPGTGKLTSDVKQEFQLNNVEKLSVINVHEKVSSSDKEVETASEPKETKKWILVSLFTSLIAIILGIFNKRFFYLIPLGPITIYTSLKVREYIQKFETKHHLIK